MKKPFLVFNRDPATGARPGLVQGKTYTTDKGVKRNKYEVLESYSATHLKEQEGTQTESEEEGGEPEEPVPEIDQGLAKDYPGTGWYKATDTGVVYNKDVPEGETHTFKGDPIEYISVWKSDGLNLETFDGSAEAIEKVVYWHNNLHRFATSNVTDMSYWMYGYGTYEFYGELGITSEDIKTDSINVSHYDTSNVTSMFGMFALTTSFNQPLDNFDTSNVTNMESMFNGATSFNQPLDNFDTSKVIVMTNMFDKATSFNQDLSSWDTSNVTSMKRMFTEAISFNRDLTNWDTSNVTNMASVFASASSFNGDISTWNTGNVTNMSGMFASATAFNQDLSNWNTSNVTNMSYMLKEATAFNQDISAWNTRNVTKMNYMFRDATSFNQDISEWDTGNVTDMTGMFFGATSFNQDLSQWCVSKLETSPHDFDYAVPNWTLPKPVWGTCPRGEDGSGIPPVLGE